MRYLVPFLLALALHLSLFWLDGFQEVPAPKEEEIFEMAMEVIVPEPPPVIEPPKPLPPPPAPPKAFEDDFVEEEWDTPPPDEIPPPDAPKPIKDKPVSTKVHKNYDPNGIDTVYAKDQKPQAIGIWGPRKDKDGNLIPEYPLNARAMEKEASMDFDLLVDTNGVVIEVKTVRSKGDGGLISLALGYMWGYKFKVKVDEYGDKQRFWTRKHIEYSVGLKYYE